MRIEYNSGLAFVKSSAATTKPVTVVAGRNGKETQMRTKTTNDPPLTVLDYLDLARSALIVANESFVREVQKTGVTPLHKRWNADMSLAIDTVDAARIALQTHQTEIDASVMELPPNNGTKRVMRQYSGRYDLYGAAAQRAMALNFEIPYAKRIGKLEKLEETDEERDARVARRESTISPALLARGTELGLQHVWYGRFRGEFGEVTLAAAGTDPDRDGMHITAFCEFGGRDRALRQVAATVARANELGYEAWCCDNQPGNGGFVARKREKG